MRIAVSSMALATILLLPSGSGAQVVRGDVAVGGGTATDQRGVHSSAVTVAPSVLFVPNAEFSAGLSATATHFGSSGNAFGGTATLGARLPIGSVFALAASGAGSLTSTSFNARYSSAELTPTAEAALGPVTLFAGTHVASGSSTIRSVAPGSGGLLPGAAPSGTDVTTSRSSSGPVFGAVIEVDRTSGTKVSYREEHARVGGIMVVDRVATGVVGSDRFALNGVAGLRDAADEKVGFGSVTATLALSSAVALQAAAGSYPSNRVTGTLGGSFASVGLSFRGMRVFANDDETPLVRGVPAPLTGLRRLAIKAAGAGRVEIAGDWNEWTPVPATPAADGTWFADVRLAPGEHRYAFRVDGKRWVVPEGVASVDDGFGGRSALVIVR